MAAPATTSRGARSLDFAAAPVSMLDIARFTKAWLDSQPDHLS